MASVIELSSDVWRRVTMRAEQPECIVAVINLFFSSSSVHVLFNDNEAEPSRVFFVVSTSLSLVRTARCRNTVLQDKLVFLFCLASTAVCVPASECVFCSGQWRTVQNTFQWVAMVHRMSLYMASSGQLTCTAPWWSVSGDHIPANSTSCEALVVKSWDTVPLRGWLSLAPQRLLPSRLLTGSSNSDLCCHPSCYAMSFSTMWQSQTLKEVASD